jgi:hypothetical protein
MTPHYRDHDRLAGGQSFFYKRRQDGRVVVSIAPHERLVPITLL